ncbi:MAG: hypothetical protein AAF223_19870, partial [Bacteroidota bacterium]
EYNALGELVDKKLHSTDNTTFTQSVDYRYNIRGWLESINNSALSNDGIINDEDDDYFGMELHYESPVDGLPSSTTFLQPLTPQPPAIDTDQLIREADQLIQQDYQGQVDPPASQHVSPDKVLKKRIGLSSPGQSSPELTPTQPSLVFAPDEESLTAGPGLGLLEESTEEASEALSQEERATAQPSTFDQRLLVNFTDALETYGGIGWNNVTSPTSGTTLSLIDDAGTGTPVSLTIQNGGLQYNDNGEQTGNDSGSYPDAVMKTYYYTNSTTGTDMLLGGLDASATYDFTFFASNTFTNNRTAIYTIGSTSVSLNASQNVNQTVQITGVSPSGSGEVSVNIKRDGAAQFGFINVLEITRHSASAPTPPADPSGLSATASSSSSISLSWTDNASDETDYEIWRGSSTS